MTDPTQWTIHYGGYERRVSWLDPVQAGMEGEYVRSAHLLEDRANSRTDTWVWGLREPTVRAR